MQPMSAADSTLDGRGWRTVRFGGVVRNVDEAVRDLQACGLERFVGLEHIDPESLCIKRWSLIADGTSFTRKFSAGQVLFGKRCAYQRKVGVAATGRVPRGDLRRAVARYNRRELSPGLP
jgi:type I restriction enzyme S subunit